MIKLVHSRSHAPVKTKSQKRSSKLRLRLVREEDQKPARSDSTGVSEFYVHAVLQAARAEKLGLDPDSAKSWGLNRAIFYEAVKKGYIHRGRRKGTAGDASSQPGVTPKRKQNFGRLYSVGNEKAYAVETHDGGVRFVIGGQAQSPDAFDKQIRRRFSDWKMVWLEAMQLMEQSGPAVLKSASRFHAQIYKRWRDLLRVRWPQGKSALEEMRAA
jgi:hypothetical protein